MSTTTEHAWRVVQQTVRNAKAMHYDGCHKLYLSMDDEEKRKCESYGYESVEPNYALLRKWYDDACLLRFVSAVYTVPEGADPNDGFVSLIPQRY